MTGVQASASRGAAVQWCSLVKKTTVAAILVYCYVAFLLDLQVKARLQIASSVICAVEASRVLSTSNVQPTSVIMIARV